MQMFINFRIQANFQCPFWTYKKCGVCRPAHPAGSVESFICIYLVFPLLSAIRLCQLFGNLLEIGPFAVANHVAEHRVHLSAEI